MSARAQVVSGLAPQQLFFEFIPDSERERLKSLWQTTFDKRDLQAAKQAESKRQKLCLKVVGGKALPFLSESFRAVLETPIGIHTESDLDVQPASDAAEEALPIQVVGPEDCEQGELSDADIALWHEKVLEYSLKLLRSKGNAEEKQEILRWIWAPSIYCWVQRFVAGHPKFIPIHARNVPFTFEACCALTGYRAEELRGGIAYVLRKLAQEAGLAVATLGIDIDS